MSSPRGSSRRYKQDEKDNAVRLVRLRRAETGESCSSDRSRLVRRRPSRFRRSPSTHSRAPCLSPCSSGNAHEATPNHPAPGRSQAADSGCAAAGRSHDAPTTATVKARIRRT
jgi:hypothetical protein